MAEPNAKARGICNVAGCKNAFAGSGKQDDCSAAFTMLGARRCCHQRQGATRENSCDLPSGSALRRRPTPRFFPLFRLLASLSYVRFFLNGGAASGDDQ